jgi:putative ABC transport system permease protein
MIKNYIKITLRHLQKDKMYSLINILGLSVGIACCLLIFLYIHNELSYDNFHENADRIYRVNSDLKLGASELALPVCEDMLGPTMKRDYPQVEEYARVHAFDNTKLIKSGESFNNEKNIAYADSTFFRVFTYPVIAGNTEHALNEPNTVVINESIAMKYFGTTNAAGKYIETKDNGRNNYKVIAVIKNMPQNSYFNFAILFPMQNLNYGMWGNYASMNFQTYLLLKDGANYKEVESKLSEYDHRYVFPFVKEFLHIQSEEEFHKAGNKIVRTLMPMRDIHLYSNRVQEVTPTGTIEYVYIFAIIASFILLLACVNFINLTTARSANRAREVGIRKVLGTERNKLILQFLSESTLTALISVILAVIFVGIALPFFNNIATKEFVILDLFSVPVLSFMFILTLIIGIAAGSYPAFFLSGFMPAEIIKGKLSSASRNSKLRNGLVVFQFVTSIILISATFVIYKQLSYIQNKNLGYQKDQCLSINDTYMLGRNLNAFKNEMLSTTGVISATTSSYLPVPSSRSFNAFYNQPSLASGNGMTIQNWRIDYDYVKTLGMKIKEGRNFSQEYGTDSSAVILNETAVKQFGYNNPVGKKIYTVKMNGTPVGYTIIGVIQDFNFESLQQKIGPLCLQLGNSDGTITLKVNAASIPNILSKAESKWKNMSSGMPFNYNFIDESFNEVYKKEKNIGIIAATFSMLAIFIACLGLFGLATFLSEQRTKEIGIRKVLGASVSSLFYMLSKEFIKWVILANLIAWPIAYYFMNRWLENYAYRIEIGWWMFALSGTIALVISMLTVSSQAIKTAVANPIDSLRYE